MCNCHIQSNFNKRRLNTPHTTAITESTEEDGMNSGIREASAEIFYESRFEKPAVLTIFRGRSANLDIKPQRG